MLIVSNFSNLLESAYDPFIRSLIHPFLPFHWALLALGPGSAGSPGWAHPSTGRHITALPPQPSSTIELGEASHGHALGDLGDMGPWSPWMSMVHGECTTWQLN